METKINDENSKTWFYAFALDTDQIPTFTDFG